MRIAHVCPAALLSLFAATPHAATPASGAVSDTAVTMNWSGPMPPVANPTGSTCANPADMACDNFQLTIAPPPRTFDVKITIASTGPNDCYYLSVFDPAGNRIIGPQLDNASATSAILHSPAAGAYTVSVAQALDQAALTATCSGAVEAYNATAQIPPAPPQSQLGSGPHRIATPIVVGTSGNEPQIAAAPDGTTLYVGALQYLYVSIDSGQTWQASPGTLYNTTANVASDSTIDIDSTGRMYFAFDYPYAGQVAVCGSDDKAQTFSCDAAANTGANDRMWIAAPAPGEAYLTTNEGLYQTMLLGSHDDGATFTCCEKTVAVASLEATIGPLLTNPKDHRLYQPVDTSASGLNVLIWDQTNLNTSPEAKLPTGLGSTYALPSLVATGDGTMYAVSDSGYEVNVASSTDLGQTWAPLGPLPTTTAGTSVFAWIAASSVPGHIGVIYYHTASVLGDTNAVWDVYWAETWQADRANPTWYVEVVDHGVHTGNLCAALSCSGNDRFAGDFISATIDVSDVPHLTWMAQRTDTTGALVTEIRYAGAIRDRIFAHGFE